MTRTTTTDSAVASGSAARRPRTGTNVLEMTSARITAQIAKGKLTICIVGVGHIGLPLALLLVGEGARVIGCDKNEASLKQLQAGRSPIVEHSKNLFPSSRVLDSSCPNCGIRLLKVGKETFCPGCMRKADVSSGSVRLTTELHDVPMRSKSSHEMEDLLAKALASGRLELTGDTTAAVERSAFVVFTVGTPIDAKREPDNTALVSAARDVGRGLKEGTVVIVRSTVSPGTTEKLVGSILQQESGLQPEKDFGLAHVPETTIEGLALFELRTLPKMIGAVDERSGRAAAAMFSIFKTPIHVFDGPQITETAKLFCNIYRDVNIALANELALACEAIGVDTMKVIEASRTDPKTNMLVPGPGVGGYCLPPWVKVQTENGLQPISHIVAGDSVLAHDGRYHKVTRVMARQYDGPILRIAGRGFNAFPIECTPEHPVLVRRRIHSGRRFYISNGKKKLKNVKDTSEQKFLSAEEIEWGDILCLPTPVSQTVHIPSVPFSYDYHRRGLWQEILSTPDMMYLFGLYIAEGSTWENQVSFALHAKEQFIVAELDSIGRKIFGNRVSLHIKYGDGMSARMNCKPLAEYLRATFGHEASEKKVPLEWAASLPEEQLRSLLRGIWLGDGSRSQGIFTYGTTSEKLWNFLQLADLRLGMRFAVSKSPRHQGRDGVWHRESYYIKSCDMAKMGEVVHPAQRLVRTRQEYRTMWFKDGFLEYPVRSVTRRSYEGYVWNLEVEGANSYVLQGGVVHNCLTKDSFYLSGPASKLGFTPQILTLARAVNDAMPSHVHQLTVDAFREAGLKIRGTRVAILGVAFKGNTGDTRESPSFSVIGELREDGADLVVHDPLVSADDQRLLDLNVERAQNLRGAIKGVSAALILTDHLEYRGLTAASLKKLGPDLKVLVDARHILDPDEVRSVGLVYRGVGHGRAT